MISTARSVAAENIVDSKGAARAVKIGFPGPEVTDEKGVFTFHYCSDANYLYSST